MGRTWLCPSPRKASTKLHETLALYLSVIYGYHGPRVSKHRVGVPKRRVREGDYMICPIDWGLGVCRIPLDSSRGLEMASSEGQLLPV